MPKAVRRVGAQTSKSRDALLDCVERLMLEEGYAAVTYRAVAAKAGVTSGLVQYYFPTLDDVFVAAIRRRTDRNLERLIEALKARPDELLHVMWEFSWDEAAGALITEFTALANHRRSIRAQIAEVIERTRQVQLVALTTYMQSRNLSVDLSPGALLLLLSGLPKLLKLEGGIGVRTAHDEVVDAVLSRLDAVEPGHPDRSTPKPKR
jgi:AcrR family transcriptional regulator